MAKARQNLIRRMKSENIEVDGFMDRVIRFQKRMCPHNSFRGSALLPQKLPRSFEATPLRVIINRPCKPLKKTGKKFLPNKGIRS